MTRRRKRQCDFRTILKSADRTATRGNTDHLIIVLGDQLDRDSPLIRDADPESSTVLMMEVRDESTEIPSHKQRTTLFLSAMRHFAADLIDADRAVRYITLDDDENTQSFESEARRAIDDLAPDRVSLLRPGDWRVYQLAESWAEGFDGEFEIVEDPHFYLTPDEFEDWADGRKDLVLEYFYRMMRKRFGVLIDGDDDPTGGEWNFDKENREPYDGPIDDLPSPRVFRADAITAEVKDLIESELSDLPGSIESFEWPVTPHEARLALRRFIKERLPRFGKYQDAMREGAPWMHHSLLSSSLNLKLLNPRECVSAAVEAFEAGDAPINSVEGFVRQLLGWREFIRGVYWKEGPQYGERNGLRQHGTLPSLYWDAETEMRCMSECVGEVIEHGYGHHIQRLMVTGNFALTSGVHPREISDWYLGMYVDAVDWVTLPNTLGMVMHADGGVVGTKPYASTGRYIDRMSDYCGECRYDPKKRDGDDACPFSVFYWDFLIKNEKRLKGNRRMGFAMKNLERLDADERRAIQRRADALREESGIEDRRRKEEN
ncbi:MAG: cryptochrome/photolyase family protein [Phycisphaerales bacterium]